MISLHALYKLELIKLRALARQRDFTPEGDAAYAAQYARTKALYVLCAVMGQ